MELVKTNRKFFNLVADFYDNGILHLWLNGILKKSLKTINLKNNSRILDAGCGTGNLLLLLRKNKSLKLYGVDISEKMLKIAKSKIRKARLKLMQVENLRDKDKFDYIFSTEAFHHYENQEKVMKNFKRALKHDGKLIVIDLDFGSILNWIFHKIEPGNNKMNSKKDFYRLFVDSGFINLEQKKIGLFAIMTSGRKNPA